MENNMSDPWIESAFTVTDEFKEKILTLASKYPQAFKISPKGLHTPFRSSAGGWAEYEFDDTVVLLVDTTHPEVIEFYREHFSEKKEKTMSKELTTVEQKNVKTLLYNNVQAIQSVLPKHITKEKMLRTAYQVVVLNPKLARDCDQLSLLNAVLEASAIGLEIGGPLAQAHLIPYKGKVKLIPDYKGLIELAYRSPKVTAFTARPVYTHDKFEYWYGLSSDLIHTPFRGGDRGQLTAAYAIVKFVGGGVDFEVVEHEDAMAAKESSPAKNSKDSPWNKPKDVWNMWVKTAVKRLLKRVPKSPQLQRALNLESAADENQGLNHILDADFETMDNITPKTLEEKPEPETGKPDSLSSEDQKTINNFEVAKDSFPDEYDQAVNVLKLKGTTLSIQHMEKIMKEVGIILDRGAA